MNLLFIRSIAGYFTLLFTMHLFIQAILMISNNVYAGAAVSAFVILLFSVLLADKDR